MVSGLFFKQFKDKFTSILFTIKEFKQQKWELQLLISRSYTLSSMINSCSAPNS